MEHELIALPYDTAALEPYISSETVRYHYGKHHAGYVAKLNALIKGTRYEQMPLENVIRSSDGAIFNNAAQVFNHNFYWHSMICGPCNLSVDLAESINKSFGSMETFKESFLRSAASLFGSGWVWLVAENDGSLHIEQTGNADTPIAHGRTPLLVCDVWEHAYYIDYRSARPDYLEAWWSLINWNFVSDNLAAFKTDEIEGYSQPCNEQSDVCTYVDTMQEFEHTPT